MRIGHVCIEHTLPFENLVFRAEKIDAPGVWIRLAYNGVGKTTLSKAVYPLFDRPRWSSIETIITCCNSVYKKVIEVEIRSKYNRSRLYKETTVAPSYVISRILDACR